MAVPIYQTVAHDFIDADHAGAIMDLETPGFHYNRINNPTVDVLEKRLTALEGGAAAMAVSSGTAAVSMSVLNLVGAGTTSFGAAAVRRHLHVLRARAADASESRSASRRRPARVDRGADRRANEGGLLRDVGNPAGNVIDLAAVAAAAHGTACRVIADNTVPTPFLLKPFEHGADVVIHSLTKFIGGHGTTLGGIIIDGGTFPWADHPDRFASLIEPEPAFHGVRYATDFPTPRT